MDGTITMATSDRARSLVFYRDGFGLEAFGPLADDGVPEPLQCLPRVIAAPPDRVYEALTEHDALAAWLPPSGMSARFEHFDGRPGGSHRLVLTYDDGTDGHGKATGVWTGVDRRRLSDHRTQWPTVARPASVPSGGSGVAAAAIVALSQAVEGDSGGGEQERDGPAEAGPSRPAPLDDAYRWAPTSRSSRSYEPALARPLLTM